MMTSTIEHQHSHVTTLIHRHFADQDGELLVGGLSIRDLVQTYGTPLFIYDCGILEKKLALLRKSLSPRVDLYYSIKANPNREILRFFVRNGCGLEIASGGELRQALSAGCLPKQIIFAGPGKTEAELTLAVRENIGEIHVESAREAKRLGRIGDELGIRVRVALRINPSETVQGGAMRMGGKPAPFGIDEENLGDLLDEVLGYSSLNVTGVHLYTGTQILDDTILLKQYRKAIEIAKFVAGRIPEALATIDFGGGLGIPYFAHESELDLSRFAAEFQRLLVEIDADPLLTNARLVVEPGRFLVGEAGLYVTRINDIKTSRGKTFVIVDGGMHHHLAASGNLGQTIKRNYPIALLNKIGCPEADAIEVVGPLCTPLDVLGRAVPLPVAEVGDLVGIFQSGAYARAASPLGFLSHPAPPEVLTEDGKHRLIRRRGDDCDFFRDQEIS